MYVLPENTLMNHEQLGDMEMDVIAICCDWTEYDDEELQFDYAYLSHDENLDEIIDELERRTVYCELPNGLHMVQAFGN